MKKIYITPEMIIRQVISENLMQVGISDGEVGFGDAEARENDDWADDEESGNIWED